MSSVLNTVAEALAELAMYKKRYGPLTDRDVEDLSGSETE